MRTCTIKSVEGNIMGADSGRSESLSSIHKLSSSKFSWKVKVTACLLVMLFSLTVLELVCYAYLRVFEGYDGRFLMNYEFDDYKNIRPSPGYTNTRGVYHNAQGFRRKEDTPKEKPNNTYRIFIMGGSTGYGLGSLSQYGQDKYGLIRNDETIDHYLEQYLKGRISHKHIEVINAAITSQQSHHHLIYLNQTILKYHPDMVIFIDGFNDYYPYQEDFDQFRDYAYQERAHLFMAEPTTDAWLGYTGWWLFRKSHFVHLAAKSARPIWLYAKRIGRTHVRQRIDVELALKALETNAKMNFVKMVERNSLILKHEGVVGVFTVQPEIVFEQRKTFTEMENDILGEMKAQWQENFVVYKNRARPIVIDLMKRATSPNGSHFVDLTDPFEEMSEDVYTDYCHLTPMGNKRLAEYLADNILPLIQVQ